MIHDSGQYKLAKLNRQMRQLVSSFPQASSELVDFHFKSTVDEYLDAIHKVKGRKLLLASQTPSQTRSSLRKVLLLGDLVVFNCTGYIGSPALSFFPIPDEFRSPVLGMLAVTEPSGRSRPPKPVDVAYLTTALAHMSSKSSEPMRLLGSSWGDGGKTWERSEFTRTSEAYRNSKKEQCHIAAGPIHVQIPKEDKLLEELKELLEDGRIAFAPFITIASDTDAVCEGVLKARMIDASLTIHGNKLQTASGAVHPLAELEIPYLENIPLSLLGQILRDEQDSIAAFRRALDRAVENVEDSSDPAVALKEWRRIKRDLLEDELRKVRQVCDRVARMNTVSRIGAYVGTTAISVAAAMGMSPPSIVCGAAGIATATIAQLYRNLEEKREIRKSPMYFLWRLEADSTA